MSIPDWPRDRGARVLTLVGNNMTIDTRARKTASSLARAGFSVIALGVDPGHQADRVEHHDGALLFRVDPSDDPRLSPRSLRLARQEVRDALRFRLDRRRARLQLRRRNHTSLRWWNTRDDPRWIGALGEAGARLARALGMSEDNRTRVRGRIDRTLRRLDRAIRFGPGKARLVIEQRITQVMTLAYRAVARPPTRSVRSGNWRRDLPELHRYEAAIGGIVDALQPDLIHAHDVFHIGLAARAKARAAADGRDLKVVYDAHEFIPGLPVDPVRREAYTDLEDEYIGRVDAVVTVSEMMAAAIADRHKVSPAIVMNAPDLDTAVEVEPVREVCGVPESASLVVYVGGISPKRGAETMVEAVASLPGVHLGLVVGPETAYITSLLDLASVLGAGDRVHIAPFVVPEGVVSYMRSADVSLFSLSRDVENFDVTLPNKLFQSIQAGVPLAVGDSPATAEFVRVHGIGEVFPSADPAAMARAIQTVLGEPGRYSAALENADLLELSSWRHQAHNLVKVYSDLGVEPS